MSISVAHLFQVEAVRASVGLVPFLSSQRLECSVCRVLCQLGPKVRMMCSRTTRQPVMGVERECKISFFVFNRCDSEIICYHSITSHILIDTGTEIRETALVSHGHTANNRKNQDVSPDTPALEFACPSHSGVWHTYLMVPSWNLRGRIKNSFSNSECLRNEG